MVDDTNALDLIFRLKKTRNAEKEKKIEERKRELKKYRSENTFEEFCTENDEYITHIDFEGEIVFYYEYEQLPCGCYSDKEEFEIDLSVFLELMSDRDYETLLEQIKKEKQKC